MIRRRSVSISRVVVATLVLALGVLSANAYTIVMRDGRRLEIPDKFAVSGSTVTYEAGSDIQVTIQLNTVDVAETERANGEGPGAFLLRANTPSKPVVNRVAQTRPRAGRTITNADLDKFRRARIEGEKEYERQRVEQGLPSREERRREAAEIQERTLEQVRYMREQREMEDAAYWRAQAESMRARMAGQAELDFWRGQVGAGSIVYPDGGFFPGDGFGFGNDGRRFGSRFGRFRVADPFAGFLSTPITPFPRFPPQFRRGIFVAPRGRVNNPRRSPGRGHRR